LTVDVAERAENLAVHVVGPLLFGGPVHPQRPFGPKLASTIGQGRQIVDNELRSKVDFARLRVARSIVAVDVVPPLSPVDWALTCALNDLIQVTNHELSSFATRGRHAELLDAVQGLCAQIPTPATLEDAVGRHATFSRALELTREDQQVSWWTGSEHFRGQEPPKRLLAWPGLRNVRVTKTLVRLADMAAGAAIDEDEYLAGLGAWLACSPLSDLATAFRKRPRFFWSSHTVSVVATVAGSNLALRALSHATNDDPEAAEAAVDAMQASAETLGDSAAAKMARQFANWLDEAKHHWAEVG
jgi:hypothetical protein